MKNGERKENFAPLFTDEKPHRINDIFVEEHEENFGDA